ncbi:type I restriction enzyme [Streptococcus pneumoniae]|nr:type I restriction enzyme [Streptococcus pneumoniae]
MTPEQLKASILQRAMEGKLVPQNPNDEPASELLKRIKPKSFIPLSTRCNLQNP